MNRIIILMLLHFTVMLSQTAISQWTNYGPYGCNPNSLAYINSTLISANSYSGVFFSSNNGINWYPVNIGVTPYMNANHVEVNNFNIFVGTNYNGIYKSTNYGINWIQLNNGIPSNASVNKITSDANRIFAAAGDVYFSSDNGVSWVNRSNGLAPNNQRGALIIDGNYVYCGTNGFYYTTDNGLNWVQSNNGLPSSPYISCLAKDSINNIIAGTSSGVYKSTNNGLNWQSMNMVYGARSLMFKDNILYAGTDVGVYKTTNLGLNWSLKNNGFLNTNFNFVSMITKDNIIFLANYGSSSLGGGYSGIYYSTNDGNNWIYSINGIAGLITNSVCTVNNTVFCGTTSNLFRSSDSGMNWSISSNGIDQKYICCVAGNGNNIFAGTDGSGIFLSTDMGNTWLSRNSGLNNSTVDAIEMTGTNTFVNATGGINAGIYFSSNLGTNWIRRSGTLSSVQDFASASNYVFACTFTQGIFVTSNSGLNWNSCNNNLTNLSTRCLNYYDNMLLAGTTLGGAFYSIDYGANWINLNLYNLTNSTVNDIISINGTIIAGTSKDGIFYTTNQGLNWSNINQGLDNFDIYTLCFDNQYLYAGSYGRSVWRRPLSQLVYISHLNNKIPFSFSLLQNYPNPFNPSTVIRFQLSVVGNILLKLYDVRGREIQTLVNERLQPGTYEVSFDGSQLTSGVYFYKIMTDSYSETKRMIMIK